MKTRTLCKIWVLTCCSLCFIACGDDNEPLSLINTEGNETLIDITSNTLQLSPFSEGESFYINGGDGAYTIDNSNEEAVKFSYDGRTLTLLPVAQGKAIITIQDRDNNTYQLQVEVTYPQETYRVSGVKASAIGDDLTQMETQLLQGQIASDIYAGIEGKYVFTYMVPDSTEGRIPKQFQVSGQRIALYRDEGTPDFGRRYRLFLLQYRHRFHLFVRARCNGRLSDGIPQSRAGAVFPIFATNKNRIKKSDFLYKKGCCHTLASLPDSWKGCLNSF